MGQSWIMLWTKWPIAVPMAAPFNRGRVDHWATRACPLSTWTGDSNR